MIKVDNKKIIGQFTSPLDKTSENITITPRRGFLYLCNNKNGNLLDLIKVKLNKIEKPKFYIKN